MNVKSYGRNEALERKRGKGRPARACDNENTLE
jgi:hypothetical protein